MPILITTSSDDRNELLEIARQLIDRQLAACCQLVGPITSTYRWNDKIEESEEWLCLIKTKGAMFDSVQEAILEMHHYDVPEITATEISQISDSYKSWLESMVKL